MSYNEHFQSKLTLLNQYTLCLEKQNQSKNKQIQTLHHHLQVITQQNQTLRQKLHEAHLKINQSEYSAKLVSFQYNDCYKSFQNKQTSQSCSQTQERQEQDNYEYEDQIKKLKEIVIYKQQKLKKYQLECEQMYEAIEKLEKQLVQQDAKNNIYNQKVTILENLLRNQEEKRMTTQKYLQTIANSVGSTDFSQNELAAQYYQLKTNLQQLIIENNMLIQRSRELQKQKNEYYHQLKAHIKMRSANQNEGKSLVKKETKIRDQRWRQIQANLQKLELQNQAMQSNLMIRR